MNILQMLQQFREATARLRYRGKRVNIGHGTYGSPQVYTWDSTTSLTIGKYCSISSNVKILLGGEHRTDFVSTYPFNVFVPGCRQITGHPSSKGNVVIGHDVWIGIGATILSGVKIGNGGVVGAQSVVARDIPPYAIATGAPAKVVKFRFPPEVIEDLQRIQWWNWSRERIKAAAPLLMNSDIQAFVEYARHAYP